MKTILLSLCTTFFSTTALANVYIKCGKTANGDEATVTGYELEVSSESDNFNGPVGNNWNLKLDETGDWLPATNLITAKSVEKDTTTTVSIKIKQGDSLTGAVGTEYELVGIYDDKPSLKKFTMGGFTGKILIGTFECFSAND